MGQFTLNLTEKLSFPNNTCINNFRVYFHLALNIFFEENWSGRLINIQDSSKIDANSLELGINFGLFFACFE
jgi:hypothetical protein